MLQLGAMDLRPRLNQPSLRCGQAAAQTFDRVDSEDRRLILIIRVEMRSMVLAARFH